MVRKVTETHRNALAWSTNPTGAFPMRLAALFLTTAYKSALMARLPAFEQQTGHKVSVQNDTAGAAHQIGRGV